MKKMKRSSYSKPQLGNPFSPTSHLGTHPSYRVIEGEALSHLLNPKWLGRGKVFFRVLRGTDPVETGWGL